MSTLICGSVAYDTIMVFHDRFTNHILPDKIHVLNVSFLVPQLRREFGGCAGNIAYNLKLLGGDPLPMATVGKDFGPYSRWMDECGVDHRYVTRIDTEYTAQAFITTDLDDNQITAFHPGAMNSAHLNEVRDASGVTIGIVAPDAREAMIEHASQFAERGTPFIFDLGQGMPLFDGDDLRRFIDLATWLTFNDYEWEVVRQRTGLDAAAVASKVEALIVTRGAQGSVVHTRGATIEIPPARAADTVDPTGCGDAYRAGLLHGLANDMDWETTGRLASLMGAFKIEQHGTQNHRCTRSDIESRFRESFGRSL